MHLLLCFAMFPFNHPGRLMVTGMAPAGRHPDVEELVFQPGGFCDIVEEADELAEIHVEKIACIDRAGDAVFDLFIKVLVLVCFEYPVPDVQQVAEIGVHVQGIAGVMHPMVRRGKDDAAHKAHPAVAHDAFSYVNEGAPGTVDSHDQEEQGRIDACQDTDGRADHIGIRGFEEEVHVGDGKVHGPGSVVRAVEAPEQPHFMTEIMINEVGEFPDDVAIDEPIPGEVSGQNGVFFKKADAKGDGCDGNETGDEPVSYKDKKWHAVVFDPEALVGGGPSDLDQQQEGDHGRYGAEDAVSGGQGAVVSFLVHFQQGPEAEETKQFVIERIDEWHV